MQWSTTRSPGPHRPTRTRSTGGSVTKNPSTTTLTSTCSPFALRGRAKGPPRTGDVPVEPRSFHRGARHSRDEGVLIAQDRRFTPGSARSFAGVHARAITQLEAQVRAITGGVLDEARERGTLDVIGEYSGYLPMMVIAEMLSCRARRARSCASSPTGCWIVAKRTATSRSTATRRK